MFDNEFLNEFGFNVKIYRQKRGLTQSQLGELVDISEHRISEIERGKCNLTLKPVNKIANALNVLPVKLFEIRD